MLMVRLIEDNQHTGGNKMTQRGCKHENVSCATSSDWESVCVDCGAVVGAERPDGATEGFFRGYIACALWTCIDDDGSPTRSSIDDIDSISIKTMRDDCLAFIESNKLLLKGLDAEQCGHDFWLTRNGHGAGFWDRGLGDVGTKLTEASKAFGECDLYKSEGVIHVI